MREPLRWCLRPGSAAPAEQVAARVCAACRGPALDAWSPPDWLLPHQVDAAKRIAGSLSVFGGAILADAVGSGKTFVALSVATRYRDAAIIAPASIVSQWRRAAEQVGLSVTVMSDSALSRGCPAARGSLVIVDEAHRYRNTETRRHRAIASRPGSGDLLLVTATPVVSRPAEFIALLSLFLPDNGFAFLGVPSLERAVADRRYHEITRAAWAVTVARPREALSVRDLMPDISDSPVVSPPPLVEAALENVLGRLTQLQYPAFRDRNAAALLAMHLRYRLASSTAAFGETLDRHINYLRRATAAAANGKQLSRRDARALFGEDDPGQLSLNLGIGGAAETVSAGALDSELDRLLEIRDLVRRETVDPKADVLCRLLGERSAGKTIVFTSAVATARSLARALGWRRVAVVTGRGAWIASGSVPVDEALALFAPIAQRGPAPALVTAVTTLIATDLASEGLNLQDADAVVHYDLPWTPLRLAQRVGRAARLGSAHPRVLVCWFAPPPSLDEGLGLARRIDEKFGHQVLMGVPASSQVGRASVLGTTFANRERFVRPGGAITGPPMHCMIDGPRGALFAVRWILGDMSVPEVLILEYDSWITDESRSRELIDALLQGRAVVGTISAADLAAVQELVRNRLAKNDGGVLDESSRRLARAVVRLGLSAARQRDHRKLGVLDRALAAITAGLTAGRLHDLELQLRRSSPNSLNNWLAGHPVRSTRPISVVLDAALFGTGTSPLS